MRSKEERRALHTTPPKQIRGLTSFPNSSRIIQTLGGIFQEFKIDGVALYQRLKTKKDAV